jgi:hypothetical protein
VSYERRPQDRTFAALGMTMIGITRHAVAGDDPRSTAWLIWRFHNGKPVLHGPGA